MTAPMIAGLAAVAAVLALLGLREIVLIARDRRRFIAGAELGDSGANATTTLRELDARFRRTRPGRWLARELDLAGLNLLPSVVALTGLAGGLASMWAIWTFLAPALAILGLAAGVAGVRAYIRRAQNRRQEAIVAQLPELARVLANASHAGLSLSTALALASVEVAEPTRTELARIANRLRFGAPLETALQEFRDRVRSREAGVLISTLVVSSRSGGSLVTALRGIAESLDQRKETRRQIKTTLSGPMATANVLIVMAVGVLALLNVLQPGVVDKMTKSPLGIGALVASGILFTTGYLTIRYLARVEP